MIEFNWSRIEKKTNNPILKDTDIDEFAELLLQDYKPKLLKEPGEIKYLHFLESYLGANIEFHDIYYEEGTEPILGATAFNNEALKVFDKEKMCTKWIPVKQRTVVIDSSVMKEGREGLALFTGLHEGGHLWLHPGVFTRCSEQLSMFNEPKIKTVVCCRTENIESFGRKKNLQTPKDWREHHADYFAAAISMPKSIFIPLANEILKSQGISGGKIVTGIDLEHDWFAERGFPRLISEAFGVSKQAASNKLKKFGFVMDIETYRKRDAQLTLYRKGLP